MDLKGPLEFAEVKVFRFDLMTYFFVALDPISIIFQVFSR